MSEYVTGVLVVSAVSTLFYWIIVLGSLNQEQHGELWDWSVLRFIAFVSYSFSLPFTYQSYLAHGGLGVNISSVAYSLFCALMLIFAVYKGLGMRYFSVRTKSTR
jgi:hypothetical protein